MKQLIDLNGHEGLVRVGLLELHFCHKEIKNVEEKR